MIYFLFALQLQLVTLVKTLFMHENDNAQIENADSQNEKSQYE
jgi:hypothetical protein